EALAFELRDGREAADQRADFVRLLEQVLAVRRRHEVVEDRSRDDAEAALLERAGHAAAIERNVAVRTKLEALVACRHRLVEDALPWRQVGIADVVDPPATGSGGD